MNIADWSQHHARSILFLLAILAIGGIYSTFTLPVGLFPNVSFPRVRVLLDAGDRPAERMVVEVTKPVEEAIRAIPGVRSVRSTTSRGSAEISINFDWGHDMVSAMLQVSAQISRIMPSLPAGLVSNVERMNPNVFPIIAYSITSNAHSLVELRDLALYQLRPVLSAVNGVAKIGVQGGAIEEYRVVVDPGKLESFNLTLADVARSLSAANVVTAVGRLQDYDKLYLAISDTRFESLDQINQTILRAGPSGGVVHLEDVARIQPDTQPQFIRVTADGRKAVLFQVYQQPGGNTVQIAQAIKAKIKQQEQKLPILKSGSVKIANWYDQSQLILASEHSTRDAILIGVGLAAIVLFLFLRNWKVTLIAMLTVPAVLAITILLLYALGMSFNIMTLGGMAAAVGLIIDDNIVIVEHITRRLRERLDNDENGHGLDEQQQRQRVKTATLEFTRPLASSSLSTIIIFLPLAFLSGVTGAFFKALSLTMVSGLVISFFIAWLAVPVLAIHWLGQKDAQQEKSGWLTRHINSGYTRLMRRLLPHAWLSLLIIIALGGLGYLTFTHLSSGFLPHMDEGGFILDYVAPPGTSLEETDRMLRQVGVILAHTPAVQTYSRRTGLSLSGGLTEANTGDFFVRLKPFPRPPIEQVMDNVRQPIQHTVPGLVIETAQLMEDLIGDLTSVPQPIEIKLYSDDEQILETVASKVAQAIRKIRGVVEVKDGIVPAGDALNIKIDRIKAALEGLDPGTITRLLNDALSGQVATYILHGPKVIGVRVWIPKAQRQTVRDLQHLLLHAPNGHLFPLNRVAEVHAITGQPEIDRDNLKRMAAVSGRITGRDLGSTIADIKHILARPGLLPAGMNYQLGGLYRQQQIAFHGQFKVMVAALLLIFTLLLFLYERFLVAIAMLITTLLALLCVIFGLWLTGTELNITSIMGMTMIVGIVTEVAIFYYSELVELPSNQPQKDRLITAGINRFRAIAMTTVAAILALTPLALGIGQGSAMLQPLAIAIIAGLLAQMPLVLIVLPALLALCQAITPDHSITSVRR